MREGSGTACLVLLLEKEDSNAGQLIGPQPACACVAVSSLAAGMDQRVQDVQLQDFQLQRALVL